MSYIELLKSINVPVNTCQYWDVRIEKEEETIISYDNYVMTACDTKPSLGAFIRVFEKGMWHYASTTELDTLADSIVALAADAKSFEGNKEDYALKPYNQNSFTKHIDNFKGKEITKLSINEKKEITESYFSTIKKHEKINKINAYYKDKYKEKFFISSEGVEFSYDVQGTGIAYSYTLIDGEKQFSDLIKFYGQDLEALKSKENDVTKAIEESSLFLNAKNINAGSYKVVMQSDVVGVFAHESFGHKSEADFMIGDPKMKESWKIGEKVASSCISIVDHGADPSGTGYCPIDDEGFPTEKTYLIKNGVLTGRLHSQYTSQLLDEAPTGNGRAISFEFEPIVRMTSTYVEAGNDKFEDMIVKAGDGVLIKDYSHGSGLSTFTIAPRKSYMIRDGKIAEPVRVSVISGDVMETLNNVEACGDDYYLENFIFGGCGKMDQAPLPVNDGGPSILINNMMVS